MIAAEPIWRAFRSITSGAEAAAYSENCIFSLATFEIDRPSATSSFALIEQEYSDVWRWAVVNAEGRVIAQGSEPTQAAAKTTSAGALAVLG